MQRHLRQRRREQGDHQSGDAAGEERTDRRDRKRRTGAALARHLVAVDAGDHRGRLARDIDQDGRGRAAVLRAVVDAGEHDQRRDRRQSESQRQQHRDGGQRPDAGEHPDYRAQQHAEETIHQVLPVQRDAETDAEVLDQIEFHAYSTGHRLNGSPNPLTNTSAPNNASTTVRITISFLRKSWPPSALSTINNTVASTSPSGLSA